MCSPAGHGLDHSQAKRLVQRRLRRQSGDRGWMSGVGKWQSRSCAADRSGSKQQPDTSVRCSFEPRFKPTSNSRSRCRSKHAVTPPARTRPWCQPRSGTARRCGRGSSEPRSSGSCPAVVCQGRREEADHDFGCDVNRATSRSRSRSRSTADPILKTRYISPRCTSKRP